MCTSHFYADAIIQGFILLDHSFRVVLVYCRRAGRIEQLCPWQQESSGCSHDSGPEKGREKEIKTLFPSGRRGNLQNCTKVWCG